VASLLALSAVLLQGSHSHVETHMRNERVRRKIGRREGRASSVVAAALYLARYTSGK